MQREDRNLRDPVGEIWLLVVQEETTVLDRRSALDLLLREHIDVLVLLDWNIRPEVPRANTNLLTDIVDTVDGTARITAGNDKGLRGARSRVLDKLAGEGLPLSLGSRDVNLASSN